MFEDKEKMKYVAYGLYLGDGAKTKRHTLSFSNGDPGLCRIIVDWLEYEYGINRNSLSISLSSHEPYSRGELIGFWSKQLDINPSAFKKITSLGEKRIKFRGTGRNGFCKVSLFNIKIAKDVFIKLGIKKESDYINKRKEKGCHRFGKNLKIEWPNNKKLVVLIKENGYLGVGKQLGVSDNAVRKYSNHRFSIISRR